MKTTIPILSLLAILALTSPAPAQCLDSLSGPRGRLAATSVNDLILFAGGDNGAGNSASGVVDIYNATSGTWTSASLSFPRYNMAATSVGGLTFFAGGGRFSNALGSYTLYSEVDVYDPALNTWSLMGLSRRRQWLAATSAGSQALFAGGSPISGPPFLDSSRVDIYDTATNAWSQTELSVSRTRLAAASSGNIALFAGGLANFVPSAVVDIYDAATGTWSTALLSAPRVDLAATSVGTRIYIAGGADFVGSSTVLSDVVDVYDTATGVWTVEQLSAPRSKLTATSAGGRALFAGGRDANGGVSDVIDVRDPGGWFTMQLAEAREELAAASSASVSLIGGGRRDLIVAWSAVVEGLPVGFPMSYCFGDGAGSACPCGNAGAAGEGCANSTGAGARLLGSGCNTASNDGLVMSASGIPAGESVLLFGALNRISGGLGVLFGDGLRCAGGAVQRLGWTSANSLGEASWGPGLAASGGYVAGDLRRFQAWYRDLSGPCGTFFNLSNGVEVAIAP